MGTHRRKQFLPPSSPVPVSVATLAGLLVLLALSELSLAFIFPPSSLLSPSCEFISIKTTCDAALNSAARIRGKIRYTLKRTPTTSLLVSLESPSSAASAASSESREIVHSNSTIMDKILLNEEHHSNNADESMQTDEVMAIPFEEPLEKYDNLDHYIEKMGQDTDSVSTHLLGHDELENVQMIDLITASFVSVSYDEHGMVQADATTPTMNSSTFSALAAIQSAQEQQQKQVEEGADYPAFIKALFQKDCNGQTLASKLCNFALLAVSFGYVFVSVFNIDRGMTRGWSPAEIGMRIPLDTWASYENSLSEKPVATKTIINIVIYLLGDWLSQTLFQRKDILDFDAARTLKNGLVGMCFGPAVHEYYEFSDWILPVDGLTFGITNRAFKILMDQTIYLSVKCSIYIIAVGILNGESVENGTENVKNRLKPIMFTAWKFWPLVHCVTYGLIPARHRILWVNSVDLVWNAILASKARGDDVKDENESSGGGIIEGVESAKKVEESNLFQRISLMLSNFNPSLQGESDVRTTMTEASHPVEDDLSGETILTNTSDSMSSLVNIK